MMLRKVYTKHFPAKGFKALTVFPFVFVREDCRERFTAETMRHETTHAIQQMETLWLMFFIIYGLEWLVKLPLCRFDTRKGYMSISFEQEAYAKQGEVGYNQLRKPYSWLKYLLRLWEPE